MKRWRRVCGSIWKVRKIGNAARRLFAPTLYPGSHRPIEPSANLNDGIGLFFFSATLRHVIDDESHAKYYPSVDSLG